MDIKEVVNRCKSLSPTLLKTKINYAKEIINLSQSIYSSCGVPYDKFRTELESIYTILSGMKIVQTLITSKKEIHMTKNKEFAHIYTKEEFMKKCESGDITECCGIGLYASEDAISDLRIDVLGASLGIVRSDFTHVAWYGTTK